MTNHGSDQITLIGVVSSILRYRRTFMACLLIPIALAVLWVLLPPRTYASQSLIMPTSRKVAGNLSSLASQFGVAMPADDPGQSPAFYADLLVSRGVLGEAVDSKYRVTSDSSVSLIKFYNVAGHSPAVRREAAIERLRNDVNAVPQNRTGTVQLRVVANDPLLAAGVSARLLELAATFNQETRRTQAAEERRFTQQRLEQVRQALQSAENELQNFTQRNIQFRPSSALSLQRDRLEREVNRQQQLYNAVSEAYEQARIEEVRNTPLFTVVEKPNVPVRPEPRRTAVKIIMGIFLGLSLAVAVTLLRGLLAKQPGDADERVELRETWKVARADLSRPWRLLLPSNKPKL